MRTNLHLSPAILFIPCLQFFFVPNSIANNGNAGTTIANPSSICVAQNVNLSIAGIQNGFGRTYQWQRSSNNFNWTNIAGANSVSTVVNVNASTWFRCIVRFCGNSTPTQSAYVAFQNTIITGIPHTENFDSSPNLPCGWSVQNANYDSRTWRISGINPRSFPRAVRYRANECQAANDWLFSPGFQLQQDVQYRVKFWYRASSCYGQEKLQVKFGPSANAADMNQGPIFSNLQINNTTYQQAVTATFSPAQNGIFYLGFHIFSQANHSGLMLDDFSIEPIGCNLTAPVITASPNTSFCTGDSITLSSSAASGNLWSNGSTQPSITVSQSGNYSVTLTENGCSASSNTIQVTVNPIPVVSIAASGSTTFCEGGSVTLTSSAAQGNLWNTAETSQNIVVSETGSYSVNVTENGCSSSSNPVLVVVNPIPVAQIIFNGSPVICEGSSIQLQSNSSSGNLWNNGNTNATIVVNQPGIYTLTVAENGCISNPATLEILVQNCVPITSLETGSCGNTQLTLSNNIIAQAVLGASSYEFIIRDATDQVSIANVLSNVNVLALNSIVPNLSPATNYVVRVRAMVNGIWGLQGPACTIGIVPVVVSAPTTKLNSAGCGNQGLTPGSTVVAIPVVGASQYEFIVLNQNGTVYSTRTQGSASLNLSVLNPALNWGTTYAITVRIFYGGNWGINGDTCTISTVPNPEIFGVPLTSLRSQDCNRTNLQLTSSVVALPVAGANQYEFEFRDVNNLSVVYCSRIQTSTTLSFTNLNPSLQNTTQYSIRVRASIAGTWGQFGNVCTIGFLGANRIADEESLEPNIETKIQSEEIISSVQVFPNPFTNELQLSLENNSQDYFYSVIDIAGKQIVAETKLTGKSIQLNNEMDAGIYWLRLRNQKGNISNCRIIKQ
jgi:hypothetical protein